MDKRMPCDCLQNPTLHGFDDCAQCILSGMYCHTTRYDAGDFEDARQWLERHAPAELRTIENARVQVISSGHAND